MVNVVPFLQRLDMFKCSYEVYYESSFESAYINSYYSEA